MSQTGARLEVSTAHLPDRFVLIVELDGLEADCEVVWRRGAVTGVMFTSPPRIGPPRRVQVVTPTVPTAAPSLRKKPVTGQTRQPAR